MTTTLTAGLDLRGVPARVRYRLGRSLLRHPRLSALLDDFLVCDFVRTDRLDHLCSADLLDLADLIDEHDRALGGDFRHSILLPLLAEQGSDVDDPGYCRWCGNPLVPVARWPHEQFCGPECTADYSDALC